MAPMVWLVTGCTSGFGEQFILSILARGDKAIATGRDVLRMKRLEEAGAAVLQLDVRAEQAVLDAKVEEALKLYGRIDVLINNAGYTDVGYWEDTPYENVLALFNTNVLGAMNLTRSLLPHFRQNGAGVVVFNSSYLAWYTYPGGSVYSGTKAAMGAMVEGLQKETASFGIKCLVMEPGQFRTPIMEKESAKFTSSMPEYEELTTMLSGFLASVDGKQPGDPRKAVEIVIDVVKQEGCAVGKEVPLRLPLGKDAAADIRRKCEETLKVLDEWKEVIESTDLDVQ